MHLFSSSFLPWPRLLGISLLLSLGLARGLAQCSPEVLELNLPQDSLTFSLLLGDDGPASGVYLPLQSTQGGTFAVKAGSFKEMGGSQSIPAASIMLSPSSLELLPGSTEELQLSLSGWSQTGRFRGNLYFASESDSCTLLVSVELSIQEPGQLQLLNTEDDWEVRTISSSFLNGLVPPRIRQQGIGLQVENTGESPVSLDRLSFSLKGSTTGNLLTEAQLDQSQFPLLIPPQSYRSLLVPFSEEEIPADEYKGYVRIHAGSALEPITMPLTIYSRMGVFGAILVLLLGIMVGRMMKDMNKAKDQMQVMDEFIPLQARTAKLADPASRQYLGRELKKMNRRVNEVKDAAGREALETQLSLIEQKIDQLESVDQLWNQLSARLSQQPETLPATRQQVQQVRQAILKGDEGAIKLAMGTLQKSLAALSAAGSKDVFSGPAINFQAELDLVEQSLAPPIEIIPVPPPTRAEQISSWFNRILFFMSGVKVTARVRYGLFRPLISLTTFLIIVLLGFQEIYVNGGDTFGVEGISDYLKLFLWGIVSDVFSRTLVGNSSVNALMQSDGADQADADADKKKVTTEPLQLKVNPVEPDPTGDVPLEIGPLEEESGPGESEETEFELPTPEEEASESSPKSITPTLVTMSPTPSGLTLSKKPSAKAGKRLYALIIGINGYKNHPLFGCHNDVQKITTYLEKPYVTNEFAEILPIVLRDGQATKANILTAFREHLGQAKAGDSVLLYFSGHGAREQTSYDIFKEDEMDSNIGGVLCATFEGVNQPNLHDSILSNKELRYLLRPLAEDEAGKPKAHLVAIFDCCNSGSNTRSVLGELPSSSRQVTRQALPGRKMTDFLFKDDATLMSKLTTATRGLDEIMPQGDHVMLSACREVELAWETGKVRQGAFTSALAEVLDAHQGRISYQELHTRVQNRMKFSLSTLKGNRGQTPQVYVRTNKVSDRYNLFLTNQPNERPSYGVVEYAIEDQEWRMALGAFHGIPMDQQQEPTKVKLYEVGKESEGEEVGIKKVFPFYCLLDKSPIRRKIEGPLPTYRAELPGLNISPLQVFVPAGTADEKTTKQLLKARLEQSAAAMINLVESEPAADIVVRLIGGEFTLTKPGEANIPLVKRIGYLGGNNQLNPIKLDDLYAQLQQISRWQTLRDLEREGIPIPESLRGKTSMYPVEFRLYRWEEKTQTESRILPKDGRFLLDLAEGEAEAWIRFELVNYAPKIFHAAMGLLGEDFGFLSTDASNPMKGAVIQLHAANDPQGEHIAKSRGEVKVVGGGREEDFIDLGLNQYHYDFNRFGETTFLKILASATPIDAIKTFHMKGLGFPQKLRGGTRGFGDSKSLTPPTPPEVEWDMRTIELFLTNPKYQPEAAPVA